MDESALANSRLIDAAIEEAEALLGDRLSTSRSVRDLHGESVAWFANHPPDAVAFVHTTQEVSQLVKICARHKVPIIPYGAGTSLEGHTSAIHGGITFDFTQMKNIIRVSVEDLDCTVEAGVTRIQLNQYLHDMGVFFPIDPGADASIGGMAATRASGTNAVRYGTMRENVLNLTVVMADGTIVKTARRARKSSAGYDLTRLIVGSEGTLGIITEVTLKLHAIPEAISAGVCPFPDIKSACDATIMAIQMGIPVARIELFDDAQIAACNAYSGLDFPETAILFLEFHGTEQSVAEQMALFGDIVAELGGGPFDTATRTEDRNRLWKARHDVYWATLAMRPGCKGLATDVCVPISRLADCVEETRADIEEFNLYAPIVGHVGDGNFHLILLIDPKDPEEKLRVDELLNRLVMRALAMEGTCTGEHGVGMGKMKFLEAEHGEGLGVMRAIKQALDPDNILNPGKVVAM